MFDWDETKRIKNIEKHGVDFRRAGLIFGNICAESKTFEDREERIHAIGFVGEAFYYVIYTWRGEARRIISARQAGRRDQRKYHAVLSGRINET